MSSFPIGSNVILHKLVKGSQYNGEIGIVKTNCDERGRQNVLLHDGNKMVAVKPDNMILVRNKKDSNDKSKSGGKSSSSKKKRGKQRKAAKEQTAGYYTLMHPSNQLSMIHTGDGAYILPHQHKLAALFVQRGDVGIMQIMANLTKEDVLYDGITRPNISLVQSGILSSVLNFLQRCEHETFDMVMASTRGDVFAPNGTIIPNVGGNMDTPSTWIEVLLKAVELEPICMLQVVESIGPLIRCFINDTERRFFKSNNHWLEGIVSFVELIGNIVSPATPHLDSQVLDALLQHEGFLTSIVQCGFWKDHRPDIVNELGNKDCAYVASMGTCITKDLLRNSDDVSVAVIGSTPIVSKDYDPSCVVSYTAGLICQTKINASEDSLLAVLVLMKEADCVDKDVITEMIDFGMKTKDFSTAELTMMLLDVMILQDANKKSHQDPNDTRTAFAIRTGLIEVCFRFVRMFGVHESFDDDESSICNASLYTHIRAVFILVHKVSLHKKSAKAIRHKRGSIEEGLVRLEEDERIKNDPNCRVLLDMVKSILNLNGSYCCRCNKSLSRKEVMECNGCGCMAYCSKACQKDDWMNGHSLACCMVATGEKVGQFQGRLWPILAPDDERAAAALKELEVNVNMIQLKLFLDNAGTILKQADDLDIPLHDCIVVFDLRCCPVEVVVKKYTDYCNAPGTKKCFEDTRSKANITCMYDSFLYNNGYLDEGSAPSIRMQRLYPHEWLSISR